VAFRILTVLHHAEFGGPHNEVLRLSRLLAHADFESHVLVPLEQRPATAARRLRVPDVELHQLPLTRLRSARAVGSNLRYPAGFAADVSQIRRLIRSARIDLVQMCGLLDWQAALAAKLEHKPLVVKVVDDQVPYALRRAVSGAVQRWADAVLATGRITARANRLDGLGERLFLYLPPVALEEFGPSRDESQRTRAEIGVAPDRLVVGSIANLNPLKGTDMLIRAYAQFSGTAVLVLVGAETPSQRAYSAKVHQVVRQCGLREGRDVIFLGPRDDIRAVLNAFDVFVLSSRSEGIPTTLLEAMACGLPCVATSVGGVPEVATHQVDAYLTEPRVEALARALRAVITDSDMRCDLGLRARKTALERFGVDITAATHIAAYRCALASAG
jgi:glycosyltransferase involved in cell wall biosynthesis